MNSLLLLKTQRVIYLSLLDEGNVLEAIKCFEKYQKQLKTYADADENIQKAALDEFNSSRKIFLTKLNNIATLYIKQKDYNKAMVCLSEVILYRSKDIYCLINYILCLYNIGQFDEEEEYLSYLETLLIDDISPEVLKTVGKMYVTIGKTEQAIVCMEKYINILGEDKISYEDYEILGMYCNELYIHNEDNQKYSDDNLKYLLDSMDYFLKADELNPVSPSVTRNIAVTSVLLNNLELAKLYWNKLFQIAKPTYDDLFTYSTFCLKNKDFKNFYKYFDYRLASPNHSISFFKEKERLWKGEDITDKTVLVFWEQGFGDTILMYGYIPRLAKIAKKVIFVVQDEVYPLLQNNKIGADILNMSSVDVSALDFDIYLPSMSIMAVLDLDETNISVGGGYIKADKKLAELFKDKYFNNDKFKIGIAYRGNDRGNKKRDIPIEEFESLCKLENIELYLLTIDITEEEYAFCKNNGITILKKDLNNFAQTAAAIENLDIVVTSDNVILNLAGAMGKKTFAIFNWYYEFRWFDLTGEDVCWFKSVKPFVNTEMDNWKTSITRVVEEIKEIQKLQK